MQLQFDPTILAEYAKRLDVTDPADLRHLPLPPDVKRRSDVQRRIMKNETFKGAYFHYLSGTWVVKFQFGGSQRVVGRTRDPERAIRYADLIAFHFWEYRKKRPAIDTDFNFPLAMVRQEYADAVDAVRLIKHLEKYFLDCGILSPLIPSVSGPVETSDCVRTKKHLLNYWEKFQIQYAFLKGQLDSNPNARVSLALGGDHLFQLDKVIKNLAENFWPVDNSKTESNLITDDKSSQNPD